MVNIGASPVRIPRILVDEETRGGREGQRWYSPKEGESGKAVGRREDAKFCI